jgi:methyl-accepting chemotaxis protein
MLEQIQARISELSDEARSLIEERSSVQAQAERRLKEIGIRVTQIAGAIQELDMLTKSLKPASQTSDSVNSAGDGSQSSGNDA